MDGLGFASPYVLLLLLAVPLLAAYAWRRHDGAALGFGRTDAAAAMPRTWRLTLWSLMPALRILAVVLLIVAVARPQRGEATTEITREGIDVVLAFDVSASMTLPFSGTESRMVAAKRVLDQFVAERENDQVGLVAFQGTSLVMSPLTTDYRALRQSIDISDRLRLRDGTAIGNALAESVNVLRDSRSPARVVILLTDGENNVHEVEPMEAARIAQRLGVRVYTVGVVSHSPTGFRSTLNVDEAELREMSEMTGGRYARAEDPLSLRQAYDLIDELEKTEIEGRTVTRFDEYAPFVLALAALALALDAGLRHTVLRRLA
jgi:Ca-activated chloride channel homolog